MNRSSFATLEEFQAEGRKLEHERINGIISLVTRLQAEGASLVEQKLDLLDIKEKSTFAASMGGDSESALVSAEVLRETIEANKEKVARSLNYLRQNNEQIAVKGSIDPLNDLLRLGKEELAATYDRLIEALGNREKAI